MNPSLSASAEDRRHDGVLCALVGLGAFLLIGGSWRGDHAVVGAVSALLGLGLALLLRWRLPGSLASRLGISLLAALMAMAETSWMRHSCAPGYAPRPWRWVRLGPKSTR